MALTSKDIAAHATLAVVLAGLNPEERRYVERCVARLDSDLEFYQDTFSIRLAKGVCEEIVVSTARLITTKVKEARNG
jgi:hypothetical protein